MSNSNNVGYCGFSAEAVLFVIYYLSWASLVAQLVKDPPGNAGDLGSIPGLGRSPAEGKGTWAQ